MKNFPNIKHCSGIYKITNTKNGHFYIGSSNKIKRRIIEHISKLNYGKGVKILQSAWNKYGEDSFRVDIVEYCPEESRLDREQFFIDTYNPQYNIAKNTHTPTLGIEVTKEIREKISKALHLKFSQEEINKRTEKMRNSRNPPTKEYKTQQSISTKLNWENSEYRNRNLIGRRETLTTLVVNQFLVKEIRNLHKLGKSCKHLSELYGIKLCTIKALIQRRNWAWVEDE